MKKYHIYGIGNALVDMEFEVTPEFLGKMNIEKGLMTLVEQERQDQLLEHLDGHQHKRGCGGSAANTVIGAAQMGAKAFYSCKVANDEPGDFYLSDLEALGVRSNLSGKERENGVTGKCMVFVTPDADRTMNTYLGITGSFSTTELSVDDLHASEYLYIEGYLVASPTGKQAAIEAYSEAKKAGVKTAITFSDPGIVAGFKDGLMQMMGDGVDLLFCNEQEALAFTGAASVEDAFHQLKDYAKSFAITLGPKGAKIYDGQEDIEVITSKVDAIDTNGAGDLFAGSFLYAITSGKSYAEAGRLACAAASRLVTQFGARLQRDEALEVLNDVF